MSVASGLRRIDDPSGMTERDWVHAMRTHPVSISTMANGMRLLQWSSGTYARQRVAVLFDANHQFVRITHRYQC